MRFAFEVDFGPNDAPRCAVLQGFFIGALIRYYQTGELVAATIDGADIVPIIGELEAQLPSA
jgi:hypothetical protein